MSTPHRQAGFFYNIWHDKSQKWTRIFSHITDCPEIDPDYLEMQKAANPIRYRQDFLFEPIFHDHIPAPKPVTAKPVTEPRP